MKAVCVGWVWMEKRVGSGAGESNQLQKKTNAQTVARSFHIDEDFLTRLGAPLVMETQGSCGGPICML